MSSKIGQVEFMGTISVDLLLLPHYMSRLGSTGFMLGLQRGLKNWAKKPATTSQKAVF
jgi:hypothetical protein